MSKPGSIIMAAIILGATALLNGQNLLQDTDFQANECGEYGYWSLYLTEQGIERLPQAGPDGHDAIRLDFSRASSLIHGGLKLVPGGKYHFGGYVRTKDFHADNSGFQLRDTAQYYWTRSTAKFPEDTNGEWVLIEHTVTMEEQRTDQALFLIVAPKATGTLEVSAPFLEAVDDAAREGSAVHSPIIHTWNRIMPFSPILSEIPADKATLELAVYTKLAKPVTEYECQVELAGQSHSFPLDNRQRVMACLESLTPGRHTLKLTLLQKDNGAVILENTYPCTVGLPPTFDVQ